MSQQHAHFEEESGGEPSDQISSAPRYEVPPWSSDQVEMPDHRLQARSLDRAQFMTPISGRLYVHLSAKAHLGNCLWYRSAYFPLRASNSS